MHYRCISEDVSKAFVYKYCCLFLYNVKFPTFIAMHIDDNVDNT